MTLTPDVPVPDPHKFMEQVRRMQAQQHVTLEGCTDAQLEAERQRRQERHEQRVREAIKLVEAEGYSVSKG